MSKNSASHLEEESPWTSFLITGVQAILISTGLYYLATCAGYPWQSWAKDNIGATCVHQTCVLVARTFIIAAPIITLCYQYKKHKTSKIPCYLLALVGLGCLITWQTPETPIIPLVIFVMAALVLHIATKRKKAKAKNTDFYSCFGHNQDNRKEQLGRLFLYEGLVRDIRRNINTPGRIWGIYGQWGSGKTHLLNYLERELSKKLPDIDNEIYTGAFTCRAVNLWQISSTKELWDTCNFILQDAFELAQSNYITRSIERFFDSGRNLNLSLAIIDTIYKEYSHCNNIYDIGADKLLTEQSKNKQVLLFFDNVERADIGVLKELLPLIERLQKIPNLTIILSIAIEDMLANCQAQNLSPELIHGHLFKLTPRVINLPSPEDSYSRALFINLVQQASAHNGTTNLFSVQYATKSKLTFDNVRQIFRCAEQISSLERVYFPESRTISVKTPSTSGANSITAIYTIELIRTLYPRAYKLITAVSKEWKNIEMPPSLSNLFIEEEFRPKFGTNDNELKNITQYQKEEHDANNKHLSAIKDSVEISEKKYTNDRLFNSLVSIIKKEKAKDIILALNMTYTTRKNLPNTLCDLILSMHKEENLSIIEAIKSADIGHFPDLQTCLYDINAHLNDIILNQSNPTIAPLYLHAAIFANDFSDDSEIRNEATPTPSETYKSFSVLAILQILLYHSKLPANTQKKQLKGVLRRISITTLAKTVLTLHEISGSKIEGEIHLTEQEKKIHIETKHALNNSSSLNQTYKAILSEYIQFILSEIEERNGTVRIIENNNFQYYHAHDQHTNKLFISCMRDAVTEWLNDYHNSIVKFAHSFFLFILNQTIEKISNEIDLIGFSENAYEIYSPILDKLTATVKTKQCDIPSICQLYEIAIELKILLVLCIEHNSQISNNHRQLYLNGIIKLKNKLERYVIPCLEQIIPPP